MDAFHSDFLAFLPLPFLFEKKEDGKEFMELRIQFTNEFCNFKE